MFMPTGIELFGDVDNAYAGLLIPVQDGPMNGCGPPVFRQKRRMNIEAVFRDLEQTAGDKLPVRCDDKNIRPQGEQLLADFGLSQRGIFDDGKALSLTIIKNLARFKFEAASLLFWGRGHDLREFHAGRMETGLEGFDGERVRSEENDFHKIGQRTTVNAQRRSYSLCVARRALRQLHSFIL